MSGEKKRGPMHDFEQGLKRIKLFSSSSGDPGPSTHSTQQVDTTLMPGTDLQHIQAHAGPSHPLHAVPPPNVEPSDNTPNPPPASISSAPPTAEQSTKRERWAQLKALANIMSTSFKTFGPLKEAVEAIEAGVETFETIDQNRADYEKLRNDLNKMFHNLAEFFDASTPPVMAPAIINFAQGIDRELEIVRRKLSETRMGTHKTDTDKLLEHYRSIQTLLQQVTSNVGFRTLRIVDEQATESRLKSLPYSPAAKYSSAESSDLRGCCSRGTRVQLLEEIYGWACNDDSQKIYWLNGMAGTGKTTIAYSFCERLEQSKKLAASFFCSRQLPSCRDVNRILPTISYQLSRFSRPFRSALSEVLKADPDVHDQVILKQFEGLILDPLSHIKDALRTDLVVVIDALDECDNNDGVDRVLNVLLSHEQLLPMKFFVASRPDAKILDRMRGQRREGTTTELRLHELGRSAVQEDIKTYLSAQLMSHMNLSAANLTSLVKRSGVLFIYASTVARYIGYDNFSRAGSRLKQILELTNDSSSDSEKDINLLYKVILASAFDDSKLTSQDLGEMKLVLHTVICAQEPLSVDVMAGLLGLDAEAVWAALRPLFSVVHVLDATHVITTLHKSFPDYLLNRNRSGVFHCNIKKQNKQLAQLCFEQTKLLNPPFNICNLESSYVLDDDIPDLPARVKQAISKQLLYACQYWVAHCILAEQSQDLVSMLREFASERFLLWMEVMNLSGKIKEGVSTLDRVQRWSSSTNDLDEGIRRFLKDMRDFAISFASTEARRSTPHIYVSTLTFWPDHSPISDRYRQQRTRLITERSTAMVLRGFYPGIISEFNSSILCVSYSPDGAYIVSGSDDWAIRVWDAHTGQPVGHPLQGHTGCVRAIACSRDGAYIVSGSDDETIRIWSTQTGQPVGQPLQGHIGRVDSVAYSPDDAYVVSGSYDYTIRIWDAHTGRPVGQPLRGHTWCVSAVAWLPDGYILSSSWDNTIRIWNARTRRPVGQPLRGHNSRVNSIAHSPDGAYIVSGSSDSTIRIWDAHTGQPVGQPSQGHASPILSVAYSSDGAYIVSGSYDRAIRIWDAHTCQPVRQPLLGHTDRVDCVAYSPTGAYMVSGSTDKTIRVWDMTLALLMDNAPEIDDGQPQLAHSLHTVFEPRMMCNLGCQISCPHMAWILNDDGWIVYNGNKLVWVPPDLWEVLLLPQYISLISPRGLLQLDLNRNQLGKHWQDHFWPEVFTEQ